jgi:diguanylate cyclase (GGDEF)-like protein
MNKPNSRGLPTVGALPKVGAVEAEAQAKRILIVEDEGITAMQIKGLLLEFGYDIAAIVAKGEDAVKKALETIPDLVLMDIRLAGEMNGIEAAKLIREALDVPVIYLSANADTDTLEQAKITQPYGYLVKPCNAPALNAAIVTSLYRHEAEKKRMEELEKAALLDHLTGLPNRRHLDMKLAALFEEMRRHNSTFGLLFLDVDHFKQINDAYGHHTGDSVLKMIGSKLKNNMRAYDFAGRWGGEEFVTVINHANEKQLSAVAEKFRTLVENSSLNTNGQPVKVTVTIGATLATASDTIESLLERADRNLYRGKTCGRNRVIFEGAHV